MTDKLAAIAERVEIARLREALQIASSLVDTPIARRRLNLEGNDERLVAMRDALSTTPSGDET